MSEILYPSNPILIVDDEYYILLNLSGILKSNGMNNIITCQDSRDVMNIFAGTEIDVLLLDLTMPHVSGQDLLVQIREQYPEVPIIIITGTSDVSTAVSCMKLGVFDYLVKSIEESKLVATINRAIENQELRRENVSLRNHLVRQDLEYADELSEIVFQDDRMKAVLLYVESVAKGSQTVLITGETGVGKELVARAIHAISGRKGEFVAVNVAGLDDTMFSDTLFGHAKGAYTGAGQERKGLIGTATGGTLFLDEIGDLEPKTQIKLLRLLETREYYSLGSDLARRTDARFVVATNQDIRKAVMEGTLRRDLYYRLQTHQVQLPPLRERLDDVPVLIGFFLKQACREYEKDVPAPSGRLLTRLRSYSFPGNVRELRSMIFDAVSRNKTGQLCLESFELALGTGGELAHKPGEEDLLAIGSRFPTLQQATEILIDEALTRSGGNQAKAAKLLGISPPALSRRLSRS